MKKILLSFFLSLAAVVGLQAQVYEKITTVPADWSGDYLIVYEDGNVAFDGSLSKLDAANNTIAVTIADGMITSNETTDAAKFTIAPVDGGYTIKSASGYYIGQTSNANGLTSNTTTTYTNTLSMNDDGTVNLVSGGAYLRYNAASNQLRFRYYKSGSYSGQKAIALYKLGTPSADVVIAPTLPAACSFVGSMEVVIENTTDGATIMYSTNGEDGDYIQGTSLNIEATTTVYAYAVKDGKESAKVNATYTRVAANPVITYTGDATAFDGSIEVTITQEENATCYYTLNGDEPTAESTQYVEPLVIKADATLKVIAIEDAGYMSSIVSADFKRKSSSDNSPVYSLVTDASTLAADDKIVIVASDAVEEVYYALSTSQNENNRGQVAVTKDGNNVTVNDEVQVLTVEAGKIDGTYAFNTGSGYLYAASSNKNYLRTETTLSNNSSWKVSIAEGVATIIAQGTNTRNTMQYNSSSSLFACYGSASQKDLSIYKLNVESVSAYKLTVGSLDWSTLYLDYDAVIPENVKAYIVTDVTDDVATLTLVTGVLPANTAVVINAPAGEYTFEVSSGVASEVNGSMMDGTTTPTYIDSEAYVLSAVDGNIGLYKAEMNGGVFLNNANKAYLPAAQLAALSNKFSFRFEDGTTAIDEVKCENEEVEAVYDLTGRRVQDMSRPGIYIVNGKKVVVK